MIIKIISAVMAFLFSLLPFGEGYNPEQKCTPEFNGTFLQSWMSSTWDDERWQTEIDYMKKAGIEYLILQDVANKSGDDTWSVYYESGLPAFENAVVYPDVIASALKNCKGTGIKVFIGLAMFDDFWVEGAITKQYSEMCGVAADMVEEIYGKYYADYSDCFYGWYFTPEFNNVLTCQININGLCSGLNTIIDRMNKTDKSLPLLLSPFYAEYLANGPVMTLANLVRMLNKINFRDGDIFAPQDAVGALWTSEENLEKIWKMYSAAVKSADADIRLWANCENFTLSFADTALDGIFTRPATENTMSITSTLDRFVWQMNVASKYAENIITFSYNHYFSPALVNPVFMETYYDYTENGYNLENNKPSKVNNFSKTETENGIVIDWDAAEDDFGIAYYRIEKNGEFLARIELCFDADTETEYMDLNGTISDSYSIVAYDAADNASEEAVI